MGIAALVEQVEKRCRCRVRWRAMYPALHFPGRPRLVNLQSIHERTAHKRAILMSTQRSMPGGPVRPATLPRGQEGRALCRWCALEVPQGRYTFCSEWCVHEWKMRTSPAYLRQQVLKRDKAICTHCRINTRSAFLRMKKARGKSREELLAHWGLKTLSRRSLWDADHILPVVEGGGECDLGNLRTLCLRCHREATAALRQRLLLLRREKLAASQGNGSQGTAISNGRATAPLL